MTRRASFAAVLLGLLTTATLQLTHVSNNVKAGDRQLCSTRWPLGNGLVTGEPSCRANGGTVSGDPAMRAAPAFTLYSQARRDRERDCRYGSLEGSKQMNVHEAHLTAACAESKMPVPGGVSRAYCIISRESGWYSHARNASGASGYFQILYPSTWRSWTQHFASWRHQHHVSAYVYGPRSNLLVGIRAASQWGWSPWSTAGSCGA